MMKRFLGVGVSVAVVSLLAIVYRTTPTQAGPLGILMVFFCLYVVMVALVTVFIFYSSRILAKASRTVLTAKPIVPVSLERSYYFSTVVSFAPVILLAMQSVGGVQFYELILVLAFIALGCVYISRRTT